MVLLKGKNIEEMIFATFNIINFTKWRDYDTTTTLRRKYIAFIIVLKLTKEVIMYQSQWKTGILVMALFGLFVVGCASYASDKGARNPHVTEAITHAQEAVEHGGMGHADAIVTHAEVSLQHAQAAGNEMSNPHLTAGIAELGEAIAHGKAGHADVATTHAKSAVAHLNEI